MTVTYENFQNLRSEEKNPETEKAAPPQSFLWNVFSWTHLLLFSLGLGFLLLVVVSVIGSQTSVGSSATLGNNGVCPSATQNANLHAVFILVLPQRGLSNLVLIILSSPSDSQLRRDLGTLRASSENLTSYMKAELQALNSKGDSLQERISSLKVDVDDHRQELLAGRDLSQKVTSLESTVEKKEQALKTDLSAMTERVQQLGKDLKALSCQLANLDSKRTCCPLHWVKHEGSCYWFSQTRKSWPEADKYCQLENAHLVVVNSMEEQNFLQDKLAHVVTWMGLTDQNGPWRWVDGTELEKGFKNWAPEQPDNWYGHGLGGGEDCAQFTSAGNWNDDTCQRSFRWVCETELAKAG